MKEKEEFFLIFFATGLKTQGFLRASYHDVPEPVFLEYMDLVADIENNMKKLRDEFEGISKEKFVKTFDLSELIKNIELKYKAFKNWIDEAKTSGQMNVQPEESLIKDTYSELYKFYKWMSGHQEGRPFEVYKYHNNDLVEMAHRMRIIGEDVIQLKILNEIKYHLEFHLFYTQKRKEIVETNADACRHAYNELKKEKGKVKKSDLLSRVFNNYLIKKYEVLGPGEAKNKLEINAKQWIRDQKRNKRSHYKIDNK